MVAFDCMVEAVEINTGNNQDTDLVNSKIIQLNQYLNSLL